MHNLSFHMRYHAIGTEGTLSRKSSIHYPKPASHTDMDQLSIAGGGSRNVKLILNLQPDEELAFNG